MVTGSPVVIKVSPMAHLAVGYLTLGLLIPVLLWPPSAPLLIIPVLLSVLIVRLRTVADEHGVTVRTLRGTRSVRWGDIDGLRFHRGSWARARLQDGDELRLPAVTFATLPQLTEASAGRVPNPYRQASGDGASGDGIDPVEQHPHSDAGGDAGHQGHE